MKTKKITEKMLLDGYDGIANGLYIISKVNGNRILWHYRDDNGVVNTADGNRDGAYNITLEHGRSGNIDIYDNCKNHPALIIITNDVKTIIGDRIIA